MVLPSTALAAGLLVESGDPRDFVGRRFPFTLPPSEIIGLGIEPPQDVNPERFRKRYQIFEPFMLYAGRIDESKGCHELFDDFIEYREDGWRLVLGPAIAGISRRRSKFSAATTTRGMSGHRSLT